MTSSRGFGRESQLNDAVRIYGYPVTSGGYNLTVTDGIISSFADNGNILTSAKVDSGNSGGLAVDQNGCWLGIPSAVVSGNYQNLGVIIPGSVVAESFLSGVPAKFEPIAVSSDTQAMPQETNDQICQTSYGTYSEWSGNTNKSGQPTCECQTGYSWNGTGDACATQLSLQQWCQNQYGAGSYSYPQNGKAVCGCSSGYIWNSDQTVCIIPQETNQQKCQDQYGVYSEWSGQVDANGRPTCDCQSGYAWDETGNACASQASLDTSCQSSYGLGSYAYTQNGKAICGCGAGYQWNSAQTTCIAQLTPDQVCQRDVGPGSYYLGYKNSDGTYACSTLIRRYTPTCFARIAETNSITTRNSATNAEVVLGEPWMTVPQQRIPSTPPLRQALLRTLAALRGRISQTLYARNPSGDYILAFAS